MSAIESSDPQFASHRHRLAIDVRMKDGTVRTDLKPEEIFLLKPEAIDVWRPPSMFKNQINLPGYFWMSQTKQLVLYESRLEMTALKFIDFGEAVKYVVAQPFCLHFDVLGSRRSHIPDFLIYRRNKPPLLLNVKPKRFLEVARNKDSFNACNLLTLQRPGGIESRGPPHRRLFSPLKCHVV